MNNYKSNFDTLGNRIADQHASDMYYLDLIYALIFAAVIALPFAIYFFRMVP